MKKNVYVSVSTDPINSYEEIVQYARVMQSQADFLHCDIMDGNFVEKATYDYALLKNINANALIPLDVHLMVLEPLKDLKNYIDAGANIVTVHYEAFENKEDIVKVVKLIKTNKALAGISLKPETPFKEVKPYCYNMDVILVMSVTPGASGQKFLNVTYDKIKEIDQFRRDNGLNFKIEVDGGVTPEIAKKLVELGVDMLVSGSYVYKSQDKQKAIESLKG